MSRASEGASELDNTRGRKERPRCPRPSTTLSDTRTWLSCSLFLDQEWEDRETELDHEERKEKEREIKRNRGSEKERSRGRLKTKGDRLERETLYDKHR